jgi:hypothetical protein
MKSQSVSTPQPNPTSSSRTVSSSLFLADSVVNGRLSKFNHVYFNNKKKIQPKKISTSAGADKSLLILGSLLKREEEKKYNQRKYQNRREPINPY